MVSLAERFAGCLFGGAVGDALGAPLCVVGDRADPSVGLRELGDPVAAEALDEMAMFTAEGMRSSSSAAEMVPAVRRAMAKGIWGTEPAFPYHAYRRWLRTQGEPLAPVPIMHGLSLPLGGQHRSALLELPQSAARAPRPGTDLPVRAEVPATTGRRSGRSTAVRAVAA